MLAEAGVPDMTRQDIPSELLQPLVPRYEEALSQLERAVKVRGRGVPDPCLMSGKTEQQRAGRGEGGRAGRRAWPWEEGWGQSCTQVSAGPCCCCCLAVGSLRGRAQVVPQGLCLSLPQEERRQKAP